MYIHMYVPAHVLVYRLVWASFVVYIFLVKFWYSLPELTLMRIFKLSEFSNVVDPSLSLHQEHLSSYWNAFKLSLTPRLTEFVTLIPFGMPSINKKKYAFQLYPICGIKLQACTWYTVEDTKRFQHYSIHMIKVCRITKPKCYSFWKVSTVHLQSITLPMVKN